jgi:hypothetical protein
MSFSRSFIASSTMCKIEFPALQQEMALFPLVKPDAIIQFCILCSRSLAVGTVNGYKLYSLSSSDVLETVYENGKKVSFLITRECAMMTAT